MDDTMDAAMKIEVYFSQEQPFKKGLEILRELALKTDLEEKVKWGAPVYTIDNKNVLGILAFKNHFGIWFFNGVFLKDPKKVLENAQEGKTKAMRHWKFYSESDIVKKEVLAYMNEAIENQKKGISLVPDRKKKHNLELPKLLADQLKNNSAARKAFKALSPYKQTEFSEYIAEAKREKTKRLRLEKILPLIVEGKGLNDSYR